MQAAPPKLGIERLSCSCNRNWVRYRGLQSGCGSAHESLGWCWPPHRGDQLDYPFRQDGFPKCRPPVRPQCAKARPDIGRSAAQYCCIEGTTPAQIALAWLLAQKPCILPIPSQVRRSSLGSEKILERQGLDSVSRTLPSSALQSRGFNCKQTGRPKLRWR